MHRNLALAFGGTPEGADAYIDLVGHDGMRVLDDANGRLVASLARIDMGQWFGGRSVPMAGIAAVAVPPESRGGKHALRMMQACMRELAAERVALSCLYASTQPLYRQVGFEQAGSRFETRVALRTLTEGTRDLPIEPLDSAEWARTGAVDARVVECYRAFARRHNGSLDRGPFIWRRVCRNREQAFDGFAVVPDGPGGAVEGYLFLTQLRALTGRHDIALSDLAFTSERAGHRLVGLLRDFASINVTATVPGGPCHALSPLLRQQWLEVTMRDYWMIRIVDVVEAIRARGFAQSVRTDVVLDLEDQLLPGNSGRWRLRVEGGEGSLERSTTPGPATRISMRGLASLYSGFLGPHQLAALGLASGPDSELSKLEGAFAGGAPWMTDAF